MSSVGDQSELRRRKAEKDEKEAKNQDDIAVNDVDGAEREYVDYFRTTYGENPRSDFLGIDGVPLFCLMYIVVAGVIMSLLFFSVYSRNRSLFSATDKEAK